MGKSRHKKAQRLQDQIAKKYSNQGEKINPITAGWMFDKWYEKLIMIALMILGVWKLFEVLFL